MISRRPWKNLLRLDSSGSEQDAMADVCERDNEPLRCTRAAEKVHAHFPPNYQVVWVMMPCSPASGKQRVGEQPPSPSGPLLPWRKGRQVPPTRWQPPTRKHRAISQITVQNFTAVQTEDLVQNCLLKIHRSRLLETQQD
jgi:hypothetical protein